jgi:cytidylate kinase
MGSLVDEFKGDYKKKSSLVVCICGPSGAGKGTLAQHVSEKLGIARHSAGDFFREIAEEKNLTVEQLSKQANKQTDIKVDQKTLEKGLKEDCVIESRISAWILGEYADMTIYVTADLEERAKRVMQDTETRKAEKTGKLKDVKQRIKQRDKDNRQRYKEYYGIDMKDTSIFDMVIDNTKMNVEEQNKLVTKALKKKFTDRLKEEE